MQERREQWEGGRALVALGEKTSTQHEGLLTPPALQLHDVRLRIETRGQRVVKALGRNARLAPDRVRASVREHDDVPGAELEGRNAAGLSKALAAEHRVERGAVGGAWRGDAPVAV